MLSEPIRNIMEQKKVLTAPSDTSVRTAAKLMEKKKVSAVMVVENKRLVGIFTERDAVFRVIAKDRDAETTRLVDVMTTAPKTVTPDQSFGYALLLMQENGFRHVPVIESGEPIGIVSARNALDPDLEEFESEARRRKHISRQSTGARKDAAPGSEPLGCGGLDPFSKERAVPESIAIWHAEHVNFARLLDLLEAEVAAFLGGNRPNYDLMGDIVYYMRSFADCVHHPREDVAFARLAEREPRMVLVINRLLQEHRVITAAGDELFNRLNQGAGNAMTPPSALETAAATYLVYYRHHLATEEREIIPRAARLLTQEDWAAVATVPATSDPLFWDDVGAGFRELRKQIEPKA